MKLASDFFSFFFFNRFQRLAFFAYSKCPSFKFSSVRHLSPSFSPALNCVLFDVEKDISHRLQLPVGNEEELSSPCYSNVSVCFL